MQVQAVLFDLFNTLVLLESDGVFYAPCLRRLHNFLIGNGIHLDFEDFQRVYFEVRENLYAMTEKSLQDPHFNVRVSQTLQRFGYKMDVSDPVVSGATQAFSDELMHHMHLDKEALNVLQALYGKYRLGLITNFAIPECCWKLLEKFGLRQFFDVVVISGEVNRRKPSPEIFERALRTLDVEASRTVFVGDTPDLDVIGPKRVGMRTVLVKRGSMEEKADSNPDRVITSLRELLSVLEDC